MIMEQVYGIVNWEVVSVDWVVVMVWISWIQCVETNVKLLKKEGVIIVCVWVN